MAQILIGVDAQPRDKFAKVTSLGAGEFTMLHRYDDGSSHNVTLTQWLASAIEAGIKNVIVQGTKIDAQNVWPQVLALVKSGVINLMVAQDDEPDLNRWDGRNKNVPESDYATRMWTPTVNPPPHPSMVGWTTYAVLKTRFDAWSKLITDAGLTLQQIPITVNFAGQTMTSLSYTDGKWHKPYISSSTRQSLDNYPFNNGKYLIYLLPLAIDKLGQWGQCDEAVIECSDQKLGQNGRGPTPAEQSTMMWSALGHLCARNETPRRTKAVTFFPQQVTGGFNYWAMTPANEATAQEDVADVRKHNELIANGTCTITQTPVPVLKPGAAVYPTSEVVTWAGKDGEKLVVELDLTGKLIPAVTYTPPTTLPDDPEDPEVPTDNIPTQLVKVQQALGELARMTGAGLGKVGESIVQIDGSIKANDARVAKLEAAVSTMATALQASTKAVADLAGIVAQPLVVGRQEPTAVTRETLAVLQKIADQVNKGTSAVLPVR